ncbi:MAG: hypothetical protein KDD40_07590 [Bdellovibrionales bacterium]|nr:hypothetical protein [Bdellovibrionales bacterium]
MKVFGLLRLRRFRAGFRLLIAVVLGSWVAACATFDFQANQSRKYIRENNPDQVLSQLKERAWKESDDQLVYLFDYGMAAQIAGKYEESNRALLLADQLSEVKDYHSLSRISGSLLLNEGMVQYKGEDYEKVILNAILALNFLMLNDHDAALVETRKLNQKLYKYKFEAKKDYEQNPFAYYLAAMIWESDRKWDDAYISFEKTYKLNPDIPYLKEDLIRAAINARRYDTAKEWEQRFKIKAKPAWQNKKQGEIVLIHLQGWGPRKRPNPRWHRIPVLRPVPSYTKGAQLEVVGVGKENSQKVYDLEKVAIKTLDDQYAPLIAKRIAAVAAKEVLADQVRQKNEALGAILGFALQATDRADLRQWSTLPESLQIAKMRVPPGTYKVRARGLNAAEEPNDESMPEVEVVVKPGRKTFIAFRTYQ